MTGKAAMLLIACALCALCQREAIAQREAPAEQRLEEALRQIKNDLGSAGIKVVEYTASGKVINTFDFRAVRFEGCTIQMGMTANASVSNRRFTNMEFVFNIPLGDLDLTKIKPRKRSFLRTQVTGPLSSDNSPDYMMLWFTTIKEKKTISYVSVVTQAGRQERFDKNRAFFFINLKNREVAERLAGAFTRAVSACGAAEELY